MTEFPVYAVGSDKLATVPPDYYYANSAPEGTLNSSIVGCLQNVAGISELVMLPTPAGASAKGSDNPLAHVLLCHG